MAIDPKTGKEIDPLAALRKTGAQMAAEGRGYNSLYNQQVAGGAQAADATAVAGTLYDNTLKQKTPVLSATAPNETVKIGPVEATTTTPTTPIITDRKPPTVATVTNPVVTKGGVPVSTGLIPISRGKYEEIISKDPAKLSEDERGFLRRVQSGISEGKTLAGVFGEAESKNIGAAPVLPTGSVTAESIGEKRKALASQTGGLVDAKKREIDAKLQQEKTRINEAGQKRLEAVKTNLSMSGFGRSSFGAQKQDEIMRDVEDQIAASQAKSELEMQMFQAQQQGADAKALEGMQAQLDQYNQKIFDAQASAYAKTLEQNNANKIKGNEAINNVFSVISEDAKSRLTGKGFDEKLSARLGYAADANAKPILDENEQKIVFSGDKNVSDVVESYAAEVMNGRANISSVPEAQRDAVIQRVAGLRREKGTSTSSVNEFKAERIVKKAMGRNVDKDKDVGYLSLVADRLEKGFSEADILKELDAADTKSASFVAGNQKLFDDMQKDTKDFTSLKTSYSGMDAVVKDALASGDENSKASADQALITLFNKMLDPTSVVREGEYDRTAQGQAILSQASGYLSRLVSGGASITDETRKDMVRIAGILYGQAEKGLAARRDQYEGIANHLGGDPEFVRKYFDKQVNNYTVDAKTQQENDAELGEIFGTSTPKTADKSAEEVKFSSGKTFKLNFNTPAQSGSTTGLKDLTAERGKSIPFTRNVGKDLNNPGNLTVGGGADKYASGFVTVTGNDGVTRKFLKFDSKDKGYEGVKADLQAKIEGKSRYVKETDTLGKLLDVWVGGKGAGSDYKGVVSNISGYALNKPVKGLDVNKILDGIKKAEGA